MLYKVIVQKQFFVQKSFVFSAESLHKTKSHGPGLYVQVKSRRRKKIGGSLGKHIPGQIAKLNYNTVKYPEHPIKDIIKSFLRINMKFLK
jgi:hypothetical protein